MASWPLRIVLLSSTLILVRGRGVVLDSQGPVLISEPRSSVEFSNETGAMIHCSAQGSPLPRIDWLMGDESPVLPIPHIREMLVNGSMYFLPFGAETYRHDVHSAVYRCQASNSVGRVLGREITVKAVVRQKYEVQVRDAYVLPGNTGVLRCEIPTFVKEYVAVTSWVRDSAYNIFPTPKSDDRHHMLPTGELLVFSVTSSDAQSSYRCRTVHRVTGDTVESSSYARLVVTDPHTPVPPRFNERVSPAPIRTGETIVLSCISQGIPPPMYLWFRESVTGTAMIFNSERIYARAGVLVLQSARAEDAGRYVCHANNTAGSEMVELEVSIISSLSIHLVPQQVTVDLGKDAEFQCSVTGQPIPVIFWTKDGLPVGESASGRSKITGNDGSTLRISSVVRDDKGMYQCFAKNDYEMVQATAELRLGDAAPQLLYKFIEQTIQPGPSVSLKCIATGNPTPHFSWTLDGFPLPQNDRFMIGQYVTVHGDVISHVNISVVHVEDGGEYRCTAANRMAKVHHSARLNIYGLPHVRPMGNYAAVAGETTVIKCPVAGFPIASITWEKDGKVLPTSRRQEVFPNGTLVLHHVDRSTDHGAYTCTAKNKQGRSDSQTVHIEVKVPAHFAEKHRNQTARLGSSASLRCEAKGDHPLKILWKKMGAHLEQKLSDYRYTLKEENTTDGIISTLEFISTSREDSARYFCIASNAYGRDEMTIHLYIQEPPDFPRNLHVIEKGSRYINISWTTSQDGNSPITQYIIEYKTDTEVWHDHTFHMTVPGSQAHAHVSGLRPAVSYQFRIYAENELGRSQASDILETTTEGEKPGGPPRNLKVDPVSSTEFNVTWDPPDHDLWNGEILGYHIGYKEHRLGSDQYTYRTVERRISTASVALGLARMSMPGTQYQLTNLKKFTRYSVVVQAYNVLGQGPMTPEVVATTLEDVPSSPPQDIRCTALTSQSLQVSWDAPPDSSLNGILKSYKVIWENMNVLTESPKSETKITSALTVVIHGLEKYTNYSVQVLASTRAGDGIASSSLYCVTEEDLPEVPAGVKAVVRSATSIIVSWQPPLRSNGNITSYNVHIRWVNPEGKWYKRSLPPYQTSYQVENLHKKNQYEFSIAAVTSVGEGPQTQLVTVSLSSEVRAAIYSFGTVLVVPWKQNVTLPCQSVGNPEPSVIWKQWGQIVKSSSRVSLLSEGSLQIMDLHREDSGNYTCYVKNRHGSDQITHRLTVQVPPAAPLLHATSATSNSINVQWKNRDDGGAPIRGYILHYKRESGEWEEMKVSHKINSFVLSRLWCGNDYQMYLTAYNRIGMGSPSEIVKATTNGSKPENSPSNGDKFVTVNVSWITLHLSMWNDGGCPITHFELEYRKNGEDIWTLVSNNIEVQKTYTLSELQPGTTYDIRTRAHNNAGFSVAEYRITTLQPHVSSTVASVEIDQYIPQHTSVYSDLKLIIPLILSSLAIIAAAGAVFYCFRKRPFIGEMASLHDAQTAAALDNKQNMEQREQYYATVRKPLRSPIHEMGTLEKIPEYSEDIYPYATFQLEESVPPGGDSRCNSAAPLQTFVYHDPRLSTADTLQLRESDCNRYTKVRGGRSSSAPLHKTHKVSQGKSESEEYDTLGSDSDTEVGTSSRTESSNHLVDSHHSVSAADSRVHNFLYHGPESSTSTEPSPIFERKSFPGRGRSKMLQLARHTSEETRSNFGPISGFGNPKHQSSNSCSNRDQERDGSGNLFVPKLDPPSGFSDAFELSEAECDLDRGHTSQRNVRDFVIAV
ncbi:Down syndrome cell adhesion molecule-like protein Dscam2 isoform X10 [Apis mellifera]|uniref:Down syndrome cell adhesion molecule-like protein Dscam2 isoform X10 n=1 Tax=Apis mellifera TaxID=7460 RepID=A0A7M7SSA2_APIME|nr:Down syndrome cell adhesion molecule-like protein Dscam2 isoform X10 [Apis mellifera]|eukprot:XP_026302209.1 Down syndrome cell adhesion molecule-like protein Dscam2 isoform X10 [Apis mellifera]